ncbi:hypothetical protein M405DRAFT_178081 [Rhizopogon salebrosus TDB-379]|nr:hypothetical protein M405DRAFT_178081 [Rhizopogon salebrosus TDB-379]
MAEILIMIMGNCMIQLYNMYYKYPRVTRHGYGFLAGSIFHTPTHTLQKTLQKPAGYLYPCRSLLMAMKLESNKAEYLAIQTTIHELCSRVDLDFSVLYNAQPTASLAKLFKLVCFS